MIGKGIRGHPRPDASGRRLRHKVTDNYTEQEGDRHLIAILPQDKRSPSVQSLQIKYLSTPDHQDPAARPA
uniref:Uncharacterized protein n=1 Tax=Siphoviridae sp. ct96x5 TaxID=2825367 RepID=A0A8S5PSG2_9CAUD|nr:MAG TPA: hypothetical protein [Siphoviridae sp. ct96x5]